MLGIRELGKASEQLFKDDKNIVRFEEFEISKSLLDLTIKTEIF
jgi:hypothetical protein